MTTTLHRSTTDCAADLRQAVELAEGLRARVADGDVQISPAELIEAEAGERLAGMQLTAAQAHEERVAQAGAEQAAAEARAALLHLETEEAERVAADFKRVVDAVCIALERTQAFNTCLALALAEVDPNERRSHAHLTPLSDLLDAVRNALGGPTHPSYLVIDDARHAARGHRS